MERMSWRWEEGEKRKHPSQLHNSRERGDRPTMQTEIYTTTTHKWVYLSFTALRSCAHLVECFGGSFFLVHAAFWCTAGIKFLWYPISDCEFYMECQTSNKLFIECLKLASLLDGFIKIVPHRLPLSMLCWRIRRVLQSPIIQIRLSAGLTHFNKGAVSSDPSRSPMS